MMQLLRKRVNIRLNISLQMSNRVNCSTASLSLLRNLLTQLRIS